MRPSTTTTSVLGLAGPQAAGLGERRVRIDAAADAPAVQKDAGVAAHALEVRSSQRNPRGGRRAAEAQPVAPHLARVQRRQRARVEDARHARRAASRPSAWAARPRGLPAAAAALPSGEVSSGGAGCGAAGDGRLDPQLPALRERARAGASLRGRGRRDEQRKDAQGTGRSRRMSMRPTTVAIAAGVWQSAPVPPLAAGVEFLEAPFAVFGVLLMLGALVSGLPGAASCRSRRRSWWPASCWARAGSGCSSSIPPSAFVQGLAVVALVLILFRDGLEVEEEMLQKAWHLPLRKLVLAMPLTAILVAALTHAVTDLDWTESSCSARCSPTDPVLSPRWSPTRASRASSATRSTSSRGSTTGSPCRPCSLRRRGGVDDRDFVWWEFVIQDVAVGLLTGSPSRFVAARLMPKERGRSGTRSMRTRRRSTRSASRLRRYGVATLPPEGNGFIAVFVARSPSGIWRPDIR